jgi:hypothetical protein
LAVTSTFSDLVIFQSLSLLLRTAKKGASGNSIQLPNSTTRVVAKEDNHT